MIKPVTLQTQRVTLRQWRQDDWPVFAALNADSEVMEFFPSVLTRQQSNELADRNHDLIKKQGWGFWAVEEIKSGNFIGFVGLHCPHYTLPFSPCIEIGWRLAKEFWGKGYASEAAEAALEFAFTNLNLDEVVSFTPIANSRSRAVMARLHLRNTEQNFPHPAIPDGHPLQEHVLYKIRRQQWISFHSQ